MKFNIGNDNAGATIVSVADAVGVTGMGLNAGNGLESPKFAVPPIQMPYSPAVPRLNCDLPLCTTAMRR